VFIVFIKKLFFFTALELEGASRLSYLTVVYHTDPALNITPVHHIQSKHSAWDSVKAAPPHFLMI